jgi:DNA-binding MarR family transcriptional regulator
MPASLLPPRRRSRPRAKRRPHFDSPQQEAFLSLWRTYDRLRLLEDELFGRHDLTAQQYNALRLLAAARPQKVATLGLGARLVSRAPDITRLLDKLAERGLIDRERPPDNRRVVHVGITPAGMALLAELAADVRACHARQLGHLGGAELRTLVELLRKARAPHEPEGSTWQ